MSQPRNLAGSSRPLAERYDCVMLDLDGVVYRGPDALPGVPELLAALHADGLTLAFVTNNAARPPAAVADHLRQLGVDADDADVVTSAQAAARELAARLPQHAAVLVVGGTGLEEALRERDLTPVHAASEDPVAVVQGFHPDVGWRQLAQAAYLIADGLLWVATNVDLTVPTSEGIAPGNGTLVAAIRAAVGRDPDLVAGKPFSPLFDETVERTGAQRPIVVGDRLDTDIEGANRCDAHSLLVMTGVTDLEALLGAAELQRPSYVAWTLSGLLSPHLLPERHDSTWSLDGWAIRVDESGCTVAARGDDPDAGLRTAVTAAWDWLDSQTGPAAALPALDQLHSAFDDA